jgi:ferredoxin-type protein NapH
MSPYPAAYRRLLPHWAKRFGFFLLGIVLLYAPFALLTRWFLWLAGKPYVGDAHNLCLRMPIQWLAQPWMWGTIFSDATYLFAVVLLPAIALLLGPLFCGWMCPAGLMTEFLSRIVPPRFQINLAGKINPVPVRYGFMAGMMGIAFIGGNACCSFCNFTHAQNIINAGFGDFLGLSYLASFSIVSFVLWFFVMGLFTKGGRGWCNFLSQSSIWSSRM